MLLRNVGEVARATAISRAPEVEMVSCDHADDSDQARGRATPIRPSRKCGLLCGVRLSPRDVVLGHAPGAQAGARPGESPLRTYAIILAPSAASFWKRAAASTRSVVSTMHATSFYLEVGEILAFNDGTATTTDLRSLVAVRKQEFAAYREGPPPAERFETRGPVYHSQPYRSSKPAAATESAGDQRKGLGCCPGVVRGKACVVRDPRHAQLTAGCILVADHTDPGWIMLFPSASGLLVERGSLLSHSAIVARELGIPAVISLPGLLDWLAGWR